MQLSNVSDRATYNQKGGVYLRLKSGFESEFFKHQFIGLNQIKNKDKQKEELDQGVHRLEQVATKCTCGKSR